MFPESLSDLQILEIPDAEHIAAAFVNMDTSYTPREPLLLLPRAVKREIRIQSGGLFFYGSEKNKWRERTF